MSPYTILFGINIAPNIWIEHLTFTLEFLLDSNEDFKNQKDHMHDLIPLGINKSMSY